MAAPWCSRCSIRGAADRRTSSSSSTNTRSERGSPPRPSSSRSPSRRTRACPPSSWKTSGERHSTPARGADGGGTRFSRSRSASPGRSRSSPAGRRPPGPQARQHPRQSRDERGQARRLRTRVPPPARAATRAPHRGFVALPVARTDGANEPRDRQPRRSLLARRHVLSDAHRRASFAAKDPVEWVHCHVARVPPSPAELVPRCPRPLARSCCKLLAKMPEERYQSAGGLSADLERCRAQSQAGGRIEPFPLGRGRRLGPLADPAQALRARAGDCRAAGRVRHRGGDGRAGAGDRVSAIRGSARAPWSMRLHKPHRREGGVFHRRQVRPVQARHSLRHAGPGLPGSAPPDPRRARRGSGGGETPCARRWARTVSSW